MNKARLQQHSRTEASSSESHPRRRLFAEPIVPLPQLGAGPSLDLLRFFHRADTGSVHFQRNPVGDSSIEIGEKVMEACNFGSHSGSIPLRRIYRRQVIPRDFQGPAGELPPRLSDEARPCVSLREKLSRDAYASLHTVYRWKTWPGKADFRWLNAAHVDCDCEDLDREDALNRLGELEAAGILPPLSSVLWTGRGFHAHWLLDIRVEAYYRNRDLLVRINRSIAKRIADEAPELAPDLNATAVTTHIRIPGSINSRVGVEVRLMIHPDRFDRPERYSLDELRDFFGVDLEAPTSEWESDAQDRVPARSHGWQARSKYLLDEFEKLRTTRGGFKKGTRRHACHLLATFMRGMKSFSKADIQREVLALGAQCEPPMLPSEAKSEFRSGMKPRRMPAFRTVAEKLQVSVGEADQLGLERIRPDYEAARASFRTRLQKSEREKRVRFLRQLAEKKGNPLPLTYDELGQLMKKEGLPTSRGTIQNRLRKLDLRVRGTRKKPSKRVRASSAHAADGAGAS